MDEEHPQLPQDSYGLSKVVNELTADMFHRRTGMQVVSCRLAIEADGLGAIALNLSSDDTSMDIPSKDLMTAQYPQVHDFRVPLGRYETLLNHDLAKQMLNWQPLHTWRNEV